MSGFGMGSTLNFLVYMALLTEGAPSVKSSINIALLAEGKPITLRRHKKVGWPGAAAHLV